MAEQEELLSPSGDTVASPCVNVCTLGSDFVCQGCGRTIEEILKWREYTIEQQTAVLDRIFGEAGNGTDCHT